MISRLLSVAMLTACTHQPEETAPRDPAELQHRLAHGMDSIDSLWQECRAPAGCTCRPFNGAILPDCPDNPPDAPQ